MRLQKYCIFRCQFQDFKSVGFFKWKKSRKSVGVEAKLIQAKCMTEPQDSKKKAKLEAAKLVNIPCKFMILFLDGGAQLPEKSPDDFLQVII